jgi:hypothetical protein
MMARVVEEADAEARGSFAEIAPARRRLRRVGPVRGRGGSRSARHARDRVPVGAASLLEEVRWPQQTRLAVIRGEAGAPDPAVVRRALGQSLTIQARAEGKVPSEVEIFDQPISPGHGRALGNAARARPAAAEFDSATRGDFRFFLRGGDDRTTSPSTRWSRSPA